ncbi:MAG: diacylglycerol kinase [Planctomycetia bacterium]
MGQRTWLGKFGDSFRGLFRAVATESSFAAHLPAAAAAIALGAWLGLSAGEWCLVALAIGGVLAAETVNSAIEMLAKALDRGPDERIRDALDMASGAVLVTVGTAIVVGLAVFGPRLLSLMR